MKQLQLSIACVCGILFTTSNANAQSWKDIFSSENISKAVDAVKEVTGTAVVKDITGTWNYSGSSNTMSMLFDADKLLQLVTFLGNKVNNATIKSITTIAESYDGMKLGMEIKRRQ